MGCAMRPQHEFSVDIIAIALRTTWMVFGDEQGIEILLCRDDRTQVVVDTEQRGSFWVGVFFIEEVDESLSHQRKRMILLKMNVAADVAQDFRRQI